MEQFITSVLYLGKKVSMVLWLIDQYTGLGCNEPDFTVRLNGQITPFQQKAGGHLVFTDLPDSVYHIEISSKLYLPQKFTVALSELKPPERVYYVALQPSPLYSFAANATLIRAALFQKDGLPAAGAQMQAVVLSDNCARAKLADPGAKKGATSLELVDINARLAPGDLIFLRPPASKKGEYCEIATAGYEEKSYQLREPLKNKHAAGELLLPVVQSWADERGEIALPFRNLRQKYAELHLETTLVGTGKETKKSSAQGLTLILGETHNLSRIEL